MRNHLLLSAVACSRWMKDGVSRSARQEIQWPKRKPGERYKSASYRRAIERAVIGDGLPLELGLTVSWPARDYPRLPLFVLQTRLSNTVLEHSFLGAQVLYPDYPFACETTPFPRVSLHFFATPCNTRRSMLKSYYAWPYGQKMGSAK